MSASTEPIAPTPPQHAAHKAWSYEENVALQAAVQQHLAAHTSIDWDVIAAAIPGRTARSVRLHHYSLPTRLTRPAAAKADYSKPRAVAAPTVRRPCLRCRMPFDSADRKRNWICDSCKRSLGENPFAEARAQREAA
jgi:Myb-like DNA-binding domain